MNQAFRRVFLGALCVVASGCAGDEGAWGSGPAAPAGFYTASETVLSDGKGAVEPRKHEPPIRAYYSGDGLVCFASSPQSMEDPPAEQGVRREPLRLKFAEYRTENGVVQMRAARNGSWERKAEIAGDRLEAVTELNDIEPGEVYTLSTTFRPSGSLRAGDDTRFRLAAWASSVPMPDLAYFDDIDPPMGPIPDVDLDVPLFGDDGPSLLEYCVELGTADDIVRKLLDAGADPNYGTGGDVPLHRAIRAKNERAVDLLLAHGADPAREVDGKNALLLAAESDESDLLWAMLSAENFGAKHDSLILSVLKSLVSDARMAESLRTYGGTCKWNATERSDGTVAIYRTVKGGDSPGPRGFAAVEARTTKPGEVSDEDLDAGAGRAEKEFSFLDKVDQKNESLFRDSYAVKLLMLASQLPDDPEWSEKVEQALPPDIRRGLHHQCDYGIQQMVLRTIAEGRRLTDDEALRRRGSIAFLLASCGYADRSRSRADEELGRRYVLREAERLFAVDNDSIKKAAIQPRLLRAVDIFEQGSDRSTAYTNAFLSRVGEQLGATQKMLRERETPTQEESP